MNGLGRKDGTWKGALRFQWHPLGEASLGSRSQLLECLQCPVASKLGWWLLRCRALCNEDTHGNEEPHSGTTEAGFGSFIFI